MNRIFTLLLAFVCVTVSVSAEPYQKITYPLFTTALELAGKDAFRTDGSWFPYPEYSDREAWSRLTKPYSKYLLKEGEKFLDYEWKIFTPSRYLEYEKTGSRALYKPVEQNRDALKALCLAELCEGKGRFLMKIADGLWIYSTAMSWSHPQHTQYQSSRRTLPEPDERPVTFHSAASAAHVALAWRLFREEFDKMDPSITRTVREAVRRNIFVPFIDDDQAGQSWLGLSPEKRILNNHTTNENLHCALCFLLMEDDPEALAAALKRSAEVEDRYLSYIRHDGACEEGNDYINAAFGKLYEYARLMCDASRGRVNVFGDPLLHRMGEYRAYSYIGDGYSMNYADGAGRGALKPLMWFRFGFDMGNRSLMDFSLWALCEDADKWNDRTISWADFYLSLETMRYLPKVREAEKMALDSAGGDWNTMRTGLHKLGSVWYPETEYAILRNPAGWFLAAKGGYNNEAHNHNDNGSGMLYIDNIPVLVDPGVGTYTKDTFSPDRYKLWMNRSDWHNLPDINGSLQHAGEEFKCMNSACDVRKNVFVTDINASYPSEACCRQWRRSWSLGESETVLTDSYSLSSRRAPDRENFIIHGRAFLPGEIVDGRTVHDGEIVIVASGYREERSLKVLMSYPLSLTPSLEVKEMPDSKFRRCWGASLTRICLTSSEMAPLKGSYSFKFTVL